MNGFIVGIIIGLVFIVPCLLTLYLNEAIWIP